MKNLKAFIQEHDFNDKMVDSLIRHLSDIKEQIDIDENGIFYEEDKTAINWVIEILEQIWKDVGGKYE